MKAIEPQAENKIHILLIHQAFAALDEPGGTRHYEMARAFVQNGHRVTIITSPVSYLTGKSVDGRVKWKTREIPQPGLEILRVYTYPALHRSFFHRLLSFFSFMFSSFFVGLGVKNVDVIWGTSPPIFQGWTAWLLARLKGVRIVFEVRDLWPAFAIAMQVIRNPIIIGASKWLEQFLYKHTDQLVVNSPGFIPHVTARGAKDVLLVPNGVDPDMFNSGEDGSAFRNKHALTGRYVVLYAGAHGVSNDLEVVLSAAKLTAFKPEIVYVFVGDGKEKQNLMQLADQLGLDNVRFIPAVAKEEMGGVLAAADACIAILKPVELYKTTYPNKVFDYMAAARPVLCAIDGAIREVVETAPAGIFVTPGDPAALAESVQLLFKNQLLSIQLGFNGREYVEKHFNRQVISARMEKILIKTAQK